MLFCQKSSLYLSDKQKNVYYLSFFIVPNYLCVVKELIRSELSDNTNRLLNLPHFVQLCYKYARFCATLYTYCVRCSICAVLLESARNLLR